LEGEVWERVWGRGIRPHPADTRLLAAGRFIAASVLRIVCGAFNHRLLLPIFLDT